MTPLRFRQVHLDYHTSEQIPGIGSEFNADEFGETLERAHVNSVTLFSRCHHGMIYHDTRFPAKHPHLTCNLLPLQVEACHKRDIRCPIYVTVGWDEYIARTHPEWLQIDETGKCHGPGPLKAGWRTLCFASPYIDYVIEQTEEVLEMLGDEVDGFFFDIIHEWAGHSTWCMAEYKRLGMDPADPRHQKELERILLDRYKERITAVVRKRRPDATIFHNSGHVYPNWRPVLHTYSHLEIESLPTGGWGYAHFPTAMRYARTLGHDCLGMTGKFAKTWGHFNSYRPTAALEYECFHMLALGAKCSIGDQLHPGGRLDRYTYEQIGKVYAQVEAKEPWCEDAAPITEIGVFNIEAIGREEGRVDPAALGAMRMLTAGRYQFDYVDQESDWTAYRLIILPDKVLLDEPLAAKLDAYVAQGGSLLATFESGLNWAKTEFAARCLPLTAAGELPFKPDFIVATDGLATQWTDTPVVAYERGLRVRPKGETETLASIREPYFERTYAHFCSHHHTPPAGVSADSAIVEMGPVIYCAHPLFGMYAAHGMAAYKDLVLGAIRRLLPDPLVQCEAPSSLLITLNRQPRQNRTVAHLLHYIPERKTLDCDTVEDVIPLHNVMVRFRTPPPSRVTLEPGGTEIKFQLDGEHVDVHVPVVNGHAMVVLQD